MTVVVRHDRASGGWRWESIPAEGSPAERSVVDYPTAQSAITDAQDRFGPGLGVIV